MSSFKIGRYVIAVFAILTGLYPVLFFIPDSPVGYLSGKGELVNDTLWATAFYMHIIGGGTALLIGWIQFWPKFRDKYLRFHRKLGTVYWIAILLSGAPGGFYIGLSAMEGLPARIGFVLLAICWFYATITALLAIKQKDLIRHQKWMIRSYALTYAAVMLRIYMPLLMAGFHFPFEEAYPTVAWLCWVPNIIVGEWIISRSIRA